LPTPQRKRARTEPAKDSPPKDVERAVTPLAARDAAPIVDDIKKQLKGKKFYPGSHAQPCSVRFSTPRFPLDKAECLLGVGADGQPTARTFEGEQVMQVLRMKPGTLKATLYKKPHRFSKRGAKPTRWGVAPLQMLSMEVSYKAGSLRGCVRCINAPDPNKLAEDAQVAGYGALRMTAGNEVVRTEAPDADVEVPVPADAAPQERPATGDVVEILDTPQHSQ